VGSQWAWSLVVEPNSFGQFGPCKSYCLPYPFWWELKDCAILDVLSERAIQSEKNLYFFHYLKNIKEYNAVPI